MQFSKPTDEAGEKFQSPSEKGILQYWDALWENKESCATELLGDTAEGRLHFDKNISKMATWVV